MGYRSKVWRLHPAGARCHGAECSSADRVRCGIDGGRAYGQSSSGGRVRRTATRRVAGAGQHGGPRVRRPGFHPQLSRACAGSKPSWDQGPTQPRERRLRPLYRCSLGGRGRGAPVTCPVELQRKDRTIEPSTRPCGRFCPGAFSHAIGKRSSNMMGSWRLAASGLRLSRGAVVSDPWTAADAGGGVVWKMRKVLSCRFRLSGGHAAS